MRVYECRRVVHHRYVYELFCRLYDGHDGVVVCAAARRAQRRRWALQIHTLLLDNNIILPKLFYFITKCAFAFTSWLLVVLLKIDLCEDKEKMRYEIPATHLQTLFFVKLFKGQLLQEMWHRLTIEVTIGSHDTRYIDVGHFTRQIGK